MHSVPLSDHVDLNIPKDIQSKLLFSLCCFWVHMLVLILELFIGMPRVGVGSLESQRGQLVLRVVKCVSCVSFFREGQGRAGLRRPCCLLLC